MSDNPVQRINAATQALLACDTPDEVSMALDACIDHFRRRARDDGSSFHATIAWDALSKRVLKVTARWPTVYPNLNAPRR